jgi:hypothetical protein
MNPLCLNVIIVFDCQIAKMQNHFINQSFTLAKCILPAFARLPELAKAICI